MFDFIANALTLTVSIALPTFLSYKALQSIPPQPTNAIAAALADDSAAKAALLSPWLTYWIVNSLALSASSTFYPFLSYIPLYSWLRLGLHTYLLVPGSAELIYQQHVRPFLYQHEREIEAFIADSHDALKARGLDAVSRAIEWIRTTVLGEQPAPPSPPRAHHSDPAAASPQSYVQALLARFSAASSSAQPPPQQLSTQAQVQAAFDLFDKFKTGFAASTSSSAAAAASSSSSSRGAHVSHRSVSSSSTTSDMKKSRSEVDFEKIEREDTGAGTNGRRTAAGEAEAEAESWGQWMFGGSKGKARRKAE